MPQQKPPKAAQTRIFASLFLALLVVYLAAVFILYSRSGGFHGFFPGMSKEAILSLRTVLAGLAIFTFFPVVWAVHKRGGREDSSFVWWSAAALALAETPCFFGLILFLLKGAFKTFFAFFALGAFYLIIAWPRK